MNNHFLWKLLLNCFYLFKFMSINMNIEIGLYDDMMANKQVDVEMREKIKTFLLPFTLA